MRAEKWAEETPRRLATAPPLKLGYAVGVFEGEGTVYVSRPNGRPNPATMRVNMTDREPLEALCEVFGGTISGPYNKPSGRKPIYYWSLTGWTAVEAVHVQIGAYLSPRRRQQFATALADAPPPERRGNAGGYTNHRNGRKTHCNSGHPLDAENTYIHDGNRHCRACRHANYVRRRLTQGLPADVNAAPQARTPRGPYKSRNR